MGVTARLPAAVVVAVTVALAAGAVACSGTPGPGPTTVTPPTTSSPSPPLTAEQARCLDEADFLKDVADRLSRIVLSEPEGLSGSDEAASDAQAELGPLRIRTVHPPFVADRAQLIRAAIDIIEGNEGLVRGGRHRVLVEYRRQVTRGGDAALTVVGDVAVKRASCAS